MSNDKFIDDFNEKYALIAGVLEEDKRSRTSMIFHEFAHGLINALTAAEQEIAELRAKAVEWIPVENSLPGGEQRKVMFLCRRHNQLCVGYKYNNDPANTLWFDDLSTDSDGDPMDEYDVYAWAELPPLPQQDNDQGMGEAEGKNGG